MGSLSIRTSSPCHMQLLQSYKGSHDLCYQSILWNKYSCMNRKYDFLTETEDMRSDCFAAEYA